MSASQSTKRPCNQTLEQHSRKERKASSKNNRGDLGHSMDLARIASLQTLGTESCNHRFEQLMVHLSSGPLREAGNPVGAVPGMSAHPSKCELGVV